MDECKDKEFRDNMPLPPECYRVKKDNGPEQAKITMVRKITLVKENESEPLLTS